MMKKLFIAVFAILLLCSCGKSTNSTETSSTSTPTQATTATNQNSPTPTQDTESSVFKAVNGEFNVTPELFIQLMNGIAYPKGELPELKVVNNYTDTGIYTFKATDEIKGILHFNTDTGNVTAADFYYPKNSDDTNLFLEYILDLTFLCSTTAEEARTITDYFFKDGNLNGNFECNGFYYIGEVGDETYTFSVVCDSE